MSALATSCVVFSVLCFTLAAVAAARVIRTLRDLSARQRASLAGVMVLPSNVKPRSVSIRRNARNTNVISVSGMGAAIDRDRFAAAR